MSVPNLMAIHSIADEIFVLERPTEMVIVARVAKKSTFNSLTNHTNQYYQTK